MNAILVDDERMSLELLMLKLQKVAPEINIIATFQKPEEAIIGIRQHQPDVVFLDIEMPGIDGFGLLNKLGQHDFEVIVTTAYSQYAIDAIRQSALDFLLKPVREIELSDAIERLKKKFKSKNQSHNISVQQSSKFNKIAIPSLKGVVLVALDNIVRLESDSNYTTFYIKEPNQKVSKKILASRTMKEFESLIDNNGFVRVHRSSIINLQYLTEYIRGEGGTALMADGSEVEVSRREKATLLARIYT
jgi:two-component system, LytTR family, response regulator